MYSQKYYIKGRDLVGLRKTFMRGVVSISILFLLLISLPGLGSAVDWNDKSWRISGCPKGVLGNWLSQNDEHKLSIENNRIITRTLAGKETVYSYTGDPLESDMRFIKLSLEQMNVNEATQIHLKIRPHLIHSLQNSEEASSKSSDCLIKVFYFESEKDAKFDKYLNWDIYKRLN